MKLMHGRNVGLMYAVCWENDYGIAHEHNLNGEFSFALVEGIRFVISFQSTFLRFKSHVHDFFVLSKPNATGDSEIGVNLVVDFDHHSKYIMEVLLLPF